MGTHPIFESDFDCLTEKTLKTKNGRRWAPAAHGRNYAEVKRHQVVAEQAPPPPVQRNPCAPARRNTPTPPLPAPPLQRASPLSNLSNDNDDYDAKDLPPPPPQRDYSAENSSSTTKPFYI